MPRLLALLHAHHMAVYHVYHAPVYHSVNPILRLVGHALLWSAISHLVGMAFRGMGFPMALALTIGGIGAFLIVRRVLA